MKNKDKTPKKGTQPKVNKTSAPAKAESANTKREKKRSKNAQRLYDRLIKRGLTEEQVKELVEKENIRIVLCRPYHDFSINLGTKKITRGAKKKEIEVPNIIYGLNAALHLAEDKKLDIISSDESKANVASTICHMWIKTTKDKVDSIRELFKDAGRLYVYKYEEKKAEEKKDKKPTANTPEAKKAAKERRKAAKKKAVDMRPYYEAKRKGGVSERIKKFNPTLAKKIQEWLDKQAKNAAMKTKRKNKGTGSSHKHRLTDKKRCVTLLEIKRIKRANAVGRALLRKEDKIAADAKKSANKPKRAHKPKDQKLKFAA